MFLLFLQQVLREKYLELTVLTTTYEPNMNVTCSYHIVNILNSVETHTYIDWPDYGLFQVLFSYNTFLKVLCCVFVIMFLFFFTTSIARKVLDLLHKMHLEKPCDL